MFNVQSVHVVSAMPFSYRYLFRKEQNKNLSDSFETWTRARSGILDETGQLPYKFLDCSIADYAFDKVTLL